MQDFLTRHFGWFKPWLMLAAGGLLIVSLTPYAPVSNLATDLPSHFVVYYATASFVLLLIAGFLKASRISFALIAAALVLNTCTLAPYLPLHAETESQTKTIKILQVNTLFLNKNTTPLAALIRLENPDIIAASEVNGAFADFFSSLNQEYPFSQIAPHSRDARGLAFLSRIEAVDIERSFIGDNDIPAQTATLRIEGQDIHFASIHPRTPMNGPQRRDMVFSRLTEKYSPLRAENGRLIIAGDFNATPWCPAQKTLSRNLKLSNAREGFGLYGSWPVWLPAPLRLPIDHVLTGGDIRVVSYRTGPNVGSDHLPTIAVLEIR